MDREVSVSSIVKFFGGPTEVGRITGVSHSAVSQWYESIPYKAAIKLHLYAYYNCISYEGEEITMDMLCPELADDLESRGYLPPVEDE